MLTDDHCVGDNTLMLVCWQGFVFYRDVWFCSRNLDAALTGKGNSVINSYLNMVCQRLIISVLGHFNIDGLIQ